jgi:hypothetical protein
VPGKIGYLHPVTLANNTLAILKGAWRERGYVEERVSSCVPLKVISRACRTSSQNSSLYKWARSSS